MEGKMKTKEERYVVDLSSDDYKRSLKLFITHNYHHVRWHRLHGRAKP